MKDTKLRAWPRSPIVLLSLAVAIVAAAATSSFLWLRDDKADSFSAGKFCWSVVQGEQSRDDAVAKCGQELEKSMTGRISGDTPPQGSNERSEEKRREFERIVRAYGDRCAFHPSRMHSSIRRNMANAVAYFPRAVNLALSASTKESAGINIEREEMIHFIRAVAADRGSFRVIYESQQKLARRQVASIERTDLMLFPEEEVDEAKSILTGIGSIFGVLTEIRSEAVIEKFAEGESTKKALLKNYESHGRPQVDKIVEDRAHALGIADRTLHKSGSRGALLIQAAGRSYAVAVNVTQGVLTQ